MWSEPERLTSGRVVAELPERVQQRLGIAPGPRRARSRVSSRAVATPWIYAEHELVARLLARDDFASAAPVDRRSSSPLRFARPQSTRTEKGRPT
jgi:hypothetical protein